ncbi:hypothetical protein JMA90_003250 [Salmonella enterica subsp. enterica serovar Schwarzengrund]|uniref:hypothetical protein n=1 Tax=Salmonella enterica TaxID=28901 RepID=UPI000B4DB316|nr:hypothetical protein [Salmonella enterica]ECH8209461.1 hypothetical protein [Salmonella enterica subsp. enterica]EAM8425013.1 hypothetical protein [Salmonella enterica]EAX7074784.1 hypothetical protein [Salmonella enterica]EBP2222469.1 hypothetical protein [Salmonella enterica]EBS1963487.1 hypothetical protein [Salmonella enterica subsp. enterica serovar Schwarzengrund]
MKQRLPAYLHQNKSSDEKYNFNDTIHNVFRLLTLIASYTPDKKTVYLSFHRAASIAQKKDIHITPVRFYKAIDKLIDINVIMRTEFKYQYRLNPEFFSFPK